MNMLFWVLMVLMLLVAIALLVYPLLRVRQAASLAYKESNLSINVEKLKELDLDLEEGRIDQVFYKAARQELDRELLIDVPAESRDTAALHYTGKVKRQPTTALLISAFIPMLAFLLYLQLGMHSASEESFIASQTQPAEPASPPSVEEMTAALEARIEKNGGSAQEWAMLARAHKYMGKMELAEKAFVVALEQDADNAQLMLELAEVMALNNGKKFDAESTALVQKAYALQPDNANVLWFAGVAEYQSGNYRQAITHLLQLLPLASTEKEVKQSVLGMIARSRQQLIAAGEEVPELDELLGVKDVAASEVASASITSLQVAVDVSAEVRQKFNANDTVFVYAKAKQGPRMPLAAKRMTLAELPATIVLDDNMAMVDGMNLSAFEQLVVSARVSSTGSAIAQSGDFIGRIDVTNKKAATQLNVVIDTLVP